MTPAAARLIAILVLAAAAGLALFASAAPPKLRGSIDANGNPVSVPHRVPAIPLKAEKP